LFHLFDIKFSYDKAKEKNVYAQGAITPGISFQSFSLFHPSLKLRLAGSLSVFQSFLIVSCPKFQPLLLYKDSSRYMPVGSQKKDIFAVQ
jgi:hypothetical protein